MQKDGSRFNMDGHSVKKKKKCQEFEWLAEAFVQRWPTGKDLQMPDIPWFSVDGEILRLRDSAILEWVLCA